MTEKVKYIFDAIDKSGIAITDFSKLTRISRESLYRWRRGSNITDKLRLDLAYTVAVRLEKACRCEELPLVDKLKPEQRIVVLRKIIASMAKQ